MHWHAAAHVTVARATRCHGNAVVIGETQEFGNGFG